jgi:demethoxyubiquinone hydroxylase (CLK1/Coq7/Cat5 family)
MEPNDLPIVCIPLELTDESAAELIAFLHNLTDAVERHYCGQLQRLAQAQRENRESVPFDRPESEPPF